MTRSVMPGRVLVGATMLVLACFACSLVTSRTASAADAEYAIRWNPTEGGPKTSAAVLEALGDKSSDDDGYEIQYFDLVPPSDAPPEASAILRQRVKNGKKHELTFKYRSAKSLDAPTCPLAAPTETKNEVDVSLTASGEPKRAFSYSCTLESKAGPPAPPAALQARPRPCTSKMRRQKAVRLDAKVEEWHVAPDGLMFEVSRNGSDTPQDLAAFKSDIADVLMRAGVKPSDRSKTELGSACVR